jgi:hypothetical protein
MRKMFLVGFAIFLTGCGADQNTEPVKDAADEPDPKAKALARLPEGVSPEFVETLVAKMEKDYPPTGYDTWAIVDDILVDGDIDSAQMLADRLDKRVLDAVRVRAENIFAAVCIGCDPPGTDDLKFVITNRTGRKVLSVDGVIQIRMRSFGNIIESLKLSVDKPMAPGGELACGGHWSLPPAFIDQLSAEDCPYDFKFVASKVVFGDSSVQQFP